MCNVVRLILFLLHLLVGMEATYLEFPKIPELPDKCDDLIIHFLQKCQTRGMPSYFDNVVNRHTLAL